MKKLNDTIAIRDAKIRAKIKEMSDLSGLPLSDIIRAALVTGLPIIERDGITVTFKADDPAAKRAAEADSAVAALRKNLESRLPPRPSTAKK